MPNSGFRCQVSGFSLALLCSAAFAQGPLAPSTSPAPTMKTLDQIEPRTPISNLPYIVSAPGSYYVTRDLSVAPFTSYGIIVSVSNVTIDLNGFALIGEPSSQVGITYGTAVDRVIIRNGAIEGWPVSGITLSGLGNVIESIVLSDNGRGITASQALIKDCLVMNCAAEGYFGSYLTIRNCRSEISGSGFAVSDSTLEGCEALYCATSGFVCTSSRLRGCGATANASIGFDLTAGSTLLDCSARQNLSHGVRAAPGCRIDNCVASANGIGIEAGAGCVIEGCVASANFTAQGIFAPDGATISGCEAANNASSGINVGNQSSVDRCNAYSNAADGISVGDGSRIEGCTVRANGDDGIEVSGGCYVLNNQCDQNGTAGAAAGIRATATSSRIEGNNTLFNADKGLWVLAGGNTIFRNSSRGHGTNDFNIAGGNDVGPIGTAAASTSPWANIQF